MKKFMEKFVIDVRTDNVVEYGTVDQNALETYLTTGDSLNLLTVNIDEQDLGDSISTYAIKEKSTNEIMSDYVSKSEIFSLIETFIEENDLCEKDIEEIDAEEFNSIIDEYNNEDFVPVREGNFLLEKKDKIVAMQCNFGDCIVEDFKSKDEATSWLKETLGKE